MIIEFITKLSGGIWALKEWSKSSRSHTARSISNLIYTKALQAKGSWISADANFANIPYFPHGIYGIFISGGASIGKNCVIFHHVTIGSNTLIESPGLGAPTIGDNCYIGAGAKIIGRVTLGCNVRVGANAVVVRDVPENSIVTAGTERIVTLDHPPNNNFYHKFKKQWRYFEDGEWQQVTDREELNLLDTRFSVRN